LRKKKKEFEIDGKRSRDNGSGNQKKGFTSNERSARLKVKCVFMGTIA